MEKVQKTDEEWKQALTPEQYNVLRKKATEAPFTGELLEEDRKGIFVCAACGNQLFESGTKFESDCGWPSFYDAKPEAVVFHTDTTLGMERTEVTCAQCDSHLGHIFEGEGLNVPTDQRYCINSVSMKFIADTSQSKQGTS